LPGTSCVVILAGDLSRAHIAQHTNIDGRSAVSIVKSRDGTTIAFDRLGDGPPVVLVGGAFQHRAFDPRTGQLAALLAERFTVYRYDRRGRGESGDTPPYAVEREIEDLDALISEVGGPAGVYGESSGGNLVLEAAAGGLAINRIAVWEANILVDDSRPPLPDDYVRRLITLASAGPRADAVAYFLTTAVGLPPEYLAPMRTNPMWAGMEAVAHTLAYDGTVVGESMSGTPAAAQRWRSVTVPTLVLDGGQSPWMSVGADALGKALPHAVRQTLIGQDHGVAPEPIAPILTQFFTG
jgi:pimeloyl-ACP methyl ester carboxylesterase